ncbi:MAG: outer membrane beta-barrel protein [Burkholderiaceae bacterium]
MTRRLLSAPSACFALAITALACHPVQVLAEQSHSSGLKLGPFIKLSAGYAELDTGRIGLLETGDPEGSGAGKLTAGYWFSRHWGVAANYVAHGEVSQQFADGTFRADGESFGIALLGRLPMGSRWDLVGKLNFTHVQLNDSGSTPNRPEFQKLTGSSANITFPGLEIGYRVSEHFRVFAEAEYRGGAGDEAGVGYSGIGLEWRF